MSSKNSFRRLLGVGAFVCCSAILLSVTAQSARNEQIPSVSELGGMIGGTLRFVQDLGDEPLTDAAAESAEEAEPAAETESRTESGGTLSALPDFTELSGSAVSSPAPAAGAVTGKEPADPASVPASAKDEGDDWMEPEEERKQEDWMGEPGEESSADPDEKSSGAQSDPDAGSGRDAKPEEPEKTSAAEEAQNKDGKENKDGNNVKEQEEPRDEAGSDWMGSAPAEEDSGVEELTAVAASTLSLTVSNSSHTEYLHGYEDGTARPEGKITRAEACQILYNLLSTRPADRAPLSDVKDGAWYAEPMRLLAACGIVDCPNDKARPDDYMTRAELVSALTRLVSADSAKEVSFTDVSESHPYYSAIMKAAGLGWVNGYGNGAFKPDGSITRAEAAKVVNRALSRTPDADWIDRNITDPLYSDLTPEHWAYYELMEASVAHNVVLRNGAEKWKPVPAEAEPKPESSAETGDEPEEKTETAAKPTPSEWTEGDEELLRMLSEPLPAEIDASRLFFDGAELYALDGDGEKMTDVTLGRFLTFGSDGRYTSGSDELDILVKDVLNAITTPDMSREEKLEAAFAFCRDSFQYRRRNYYEPGETGWFADEAYTMFRTRKGNCYNFAAAFAALARQLGYDAETVSGLVGIELQAHGWVEIVSDGARLYYDTVLESTYIERGYQPFDFFAKQYETAPWPYHKR